MKKHLFTFLSIIIAGSAYSQCQNSSAFGMVTLDPAPASSQTIFCNYAEEYGTWDGVVAGYSYTTTSDIATDFITVRSGSPGGPVVAFGVQPLNWTATVAGTHYIHINTDSGCGQNTDCRDITTTNNGPAFACSNPVEAGTTQANVITACPGSPFLLTLSGSSLGSGLDYQWQSSTNGTTWTDIVGANGTSYSATQTAATYYRCIVTCSAGSTDNSTPIQVLMGDCITMGNGTFSSCGGNFYDSGGATGPYMNNENYTLTISPTLAGSLVQLNFSAFDVETFWEEMTIYNGNSTAAPMLGAFDTDPGAITSTAADGSLTIVFTSDGSVTYDGWAATIGCVTPPANDLACSAITIPVDGSVNTYNNGGATVEPGEILVAPATTGYNETDGWGESTLSFTTWFTFDAPASGNVSIDCSDNDFNGQVAVYAVSDCGDFSTYDFVAGNDDAMDYSSVAPKFTICGLTPGDTYYLMFDSQSTYSSGAFTISISDLNVNAGEFVEVLNACSGETVDLFDGIQNYDAGGTWYEYIPTVGLSGSTFNTAGLAYQVFNFDYVVVEGCASDTVTGQVHIFGPSQAGSDGTLDVCRNQLYSLLDGLSGQIDLGGTWYDPNDNPLPGNTVTASNIPGQYNFNYITGNGVCPDDTSNVLVNVIDCTAGIEENTIETISIFPNPTNGIVFISNEGSQEIYSYEVLDLNGRKITSATDAVTSSEMTTVDLSGMQAGVYLIRVYNASAGRTYRIVLN